MRTVEKRDTAHWEARGTVFKFSADEMRDAGVQLGPSKRLVYVPRSVVLPSGSRRFGRLVHEPTMDELLALGVEPFETLDAGHNLLANAGINRLESLLIGAGGQAYDATHTAILVGDGAGSVPTAAASDTDLAALVNAANRWAQVADATFPSQATQVITIQATVPQGNGNFEWREWGVAQNVASAAAAATAPLLNHKGIDLGLKTSAAAWAFKITITIS